MAVQKSALAEAELPPSLRVTPNIPPSEQTLEQLLAERAYWKARLDAKSGWGAAVGALGEMVSDLDRWISIRKADLRPQEKSVYVAAPFAWRAEAISAARILTERGFRSTARWHSSPGVDPRTDGAGSRKAAEEDVEDVLAAQVLLVLTDERPIGAGHHVELGLAIVARRVDPTRKIVVAGPTKSVFHWLADEVFADWAVAVAASKFLR